MNLEIQFWKTIRGPLQNRVMWYEQYGGDAIGLKITGRIWAACFIALANFVLRQSLVNIEQLRLHAVFHWNHSSEAP